MPLSYREIAEIMKLIDQSSCDEFVVEVGDLKLAVRRKSAKSGLSDPSPAVAPSPPDAPVAASGTSSASPVSTDVNSSAPAVKTKPERVDGVVEVRSPMSGIFYRSPAPDAGPFVSVGSPVNKGDPLCLVEVMKLFTTIHAEQRGRIVEITAEDGQLVEHDQILFLIEPS